MRFLFIILIVCFGCQTKQINKSPKPIDTKFKEVDRDWEYLYALELASALKNDDDVAFHFFWIHYLKARGENKLKILDKNSSPQ